MIDREEMIPCRACGRVFRKYGYAAVPPDRDGLWWENWCDTCITLCRNSAGLGLYSPNENETDEECRRRRARGPTEEEINLYLATVLSNLLVRQRRGLSITRCEALCGPGDQCLAYEQKMFENRCVCEPHWHALMKGRNLSFAPRTGEFMRKTVCIIADSPDLLVRRIRMVVPKDWNITISTSNPEPSTRMAALASRGGKARLRTMSSEARSEQAKRAAQARWSK